MSLIFIILAGVIHFYIFILESFLWGRAKTNRVFAVTSEIAEHNRMFAFNQGFYNLFLAIAAVGGAFLCFSEHPAGPVLVTYSALSMVGASLVLFYSQPKLLRAVLIQGLPPLIGLIISVLS